MAELPKLADVLHTSESTTSEFTIILCHHQVDVLKHGMLDNHVSANLAVPRHENLCL